MKRIPFLCLLLFAALNVRAGSPDEAILIRLTRDFEQAVAARDRTALKSLLHDGYACAGMGRPADSLENRIGQRLSVALSRNDGTLDIRVAGDTAIVMGAYQVSGGADASRSAAKGRFTATWVKSSGEWRLLAEHRSLDGEQASVAVAQTSVRQSSVAASASEATAPAVTPADGSGEQAKSRSMDSDETRAHRGLLPRSFANLFRAYEPNQVGYTWDQGDDAFLDFTFSVMFPLLPGQAYPDPVRRHRETDFFRPVRYGSPKLYFAATERAGQYIATRPSSPVIGKRFNPLVALRFWAEDAGRSAESEGNFLEFVYAHESNGQFIASLDRFNEQLRVYLHQANDASTPEDAAIARRTAYRSARDNISRGWDYVGVQFARDWDSKLPWLKERDVTMSLQAKFNYYLSTGLAQGGAEEYNAWEADPEGKARKFVDGITLRYTLTVSPDHDAQEFREWYKILKFERRYSFTWTTGYAEPFRYNTVKVEAGVTLFGKLPLTFWYRHGYNSDLIDYYRKDHSLGLSLSYWSF